MESMGKHEFRAIIADALADADLDPADVGITADDEGRIVLVLDGLTFDDHENVVKTEREYSVEVSMSVTLTVGVTAASEDDARGKVEVEMQWASVEVDVGSLDLQDVDHAVDHIGDVESQ
jgi:hypothetical protein